ncbi:hypothetical protein DNL40_12465 [Xylanimonas oleitrophica]|uniref:Uncharacterized protein n=1 Tax=Xylanimonas oleitrophica TaxID=2607479 RepID=A0A2W5WWT1_9MICO|nr:hypothetical protein [Xylanimonas oleitrophica]PZR52245.1 hypothetical protein DNL40_12465 [Xylanimonas oleitrophica]
MTFDADDLLAGPRGRRLCLALVVDADDGVREAVRDAAYELDPGRGTTVMRLGAGGHRHASRTPRVSPTDVARAIDAAGVPAVDARRLLLALAAAVDHARYWQPPDGEDVLAATPEVCAALRPVADAVVTSPHTRWWSAPCATAEQSAVRVSPYDADAAWPERGVVQAPVDGAARVLDAWRRATRRTEQRWPAERGVPLGEGTSGEWWSSPPHGLARTTRHVDGFGPASLWLAEDSYGPDAALVAAVTLPEGARVIEVDGPQEWADLCRRFPLEVTASRRHDWFRTTGRGEGRWVLPDWAAVAEVADGVHVSVAGYLATAGRAVPVADGVTSVPAGWSPDTTWWLRDVVEEGPAVGWRYDRERDAWAPARD